MEALRLLKWADIFCSYSDWPLYCSPISLMLLLIIFSDFEIVSKVFVRSSFNFSRTVLVLGKLNIVDVVLFLDMLTAAFGWLDVSPPLLCVCLCLNLQLICYSFAFEFPVIFAHRWMDYLFFLVDNCRSDLLLLLEFVFLDHISFINHFFVLFWSFLFFLSLLLDLLYFFIGGLLEVEIFFLHCSRGESIQNQEDILTTSRFEFEGLEIAGNL